MPNRGVRAAAEGMPAINRRALIVASSGLAAALTTMAMPRQAAGETNPVPSDEQEIARLINAYRDAERTYNALADGHEASLASLRPFNHPETKKLEVRVDEAFLAWSAVFRDLLAAPCRSFRAVQMKTELLLSDQTGAFGQGMEYRETEILLRSFGSVQS